MKCSFKYERKDFGKILNLHILGNRGEIPPHIGSKAVRSCFNLLPGGSLKGSDVKQTAFCVMVTGQI